MTKLMIGRARWLLVRILVGVSLAYGVTFFVLWTQLEKRFVFFPSTELLYTPSDVGLQYEDVRIQTSDGLSLHAWFIPGDPEIAPKATWVWFHGNGGNNGYRVDELALAHHRTGANLFIFDYRGYGESEGSPTEKGTYLDSQAVRDYLESRPDVDED
ncbi:MAG: alpha/beta hydrolase, partial [Chloroflexi bacterium]|nr:alpha/beta hydrolase [Chloroflexota bacterium]